ncbi:UNVERIFIED_CONTAM: hypothetical protein Sradi_5293800 [Sesamum radiatum]|uniref:Uncharacterized protein n=1 Tax=Sesamum radiatum TaxID=300843 RepID=A0AAW2LNS8_SESRA
MEVMGAVERPMMEYSFPTADGTISSIVKPVVEANNFEIKPAIIQIIRSNVQFSGLPDEDPNKHLVQTFYNGATLANRATIDAAAGGTIMKKLPSEAFNIIDEIATNLYSYGQERAEKRAAGIHSIDAISSLSAQMSAQMTTLTHRMDNLGAAIWNGAPMEPYGACGQMGHLSQDCQVGNANIINEDANFVSHGGRSNFNPYSNTYNLGGAVTQIFHRVTINSRDLLDTINLDRYNLHKRRKATLKMYSPNSSSQQTPDFKIKMPDSKVKKHRFENRGANWAIGKHGFRKKRGSTTKCRNSAKLLKEVLSTKRKWEGGEAVKLNEECSAILQNKLPPKLKDPGSFSIPCTIGNTDFDKVLCDLGASVNLMPYYIFKRFGMHELTPSIITLQLADRSIKYPRGIVEDVLSIDVQKGQLTLRINEEHVVFNVLKPIKYLHKKEHDIFAIDIINTFGTDNVHLVKCEDPKEDRIENSNEDNLQDMKEEHEEVPNFVDTEQEVKSKLQKELLLNRSTSNQKAKLPSKVLSNRKKASKDKWVPPNRMKRWTNQIDKNVGFYKDHTKAWNESHMRKKKFKNGDKRHHKNKDHIKVDWRRLKH